MATDMVAVVFERTLRDTVIDTGRTRPELAFAAHKINVASQGMVHALQWRELGTGKRRTPMDHWNSLLVGFCPPFPFVFCTPRVQDCLYYLEMSAEASPPSSIWLCPGSADPP